MDPNKTKEDLSSRELNAVSGGADVNLLVDACPHCGFKASKTTQYPDGFYEFTNPGCTTIIGYRCPKCKFSWSVTK